MKAVVLDPANEFNVDRTLTKEDVQKLIKVKTVMPLEIDKSLLLVLLLWTCISIDIGLFVFFIQICVDRLLDTRSPALDTVKMQVYFDMNYTTRCKSLKYRTNKKHLALILRDIPTTPPPPPHSDHSRPNLFWEGGSPIYLVRGLGRGGTDHSPAWGGGSTGS